MSKTKIERRTDGESAPKIHTLSSAASATLEQSVDLLKLIDDLEQASGISDPYWKWVKELGEDVATATDPDLESDVALLRQTNAGDIIAQDARHVGFVIGFEYAMRLMRGDGSAKLPGGAR